jgi:hypothetical protein
MRFLYRIYRVVIMAGACLLLISCGGQSSNDSSSSTIVQSPTWQLDGNGFVQFVTNDPQYYQYTSWYIIGPNENLMSTVTATIKKQSGNAGTGYGIIFCYQDNNNFYSLSIETTGHYHVWARIGGAYSELVSWTASTDLNNGFGVENEVSVVQTSLYNFAVFFNGTQVRTFTDTGFNFFGGRAGLYASIYDQAHENFPSTPVDVRFKMSSPIVYP